MDLQQLIMITITSGYMIHQAAMGTGDTHHVLKTFLLAGKKKRIYEILNLFLSSYLFQEHFIIFLYCYNPYLLCSFHYSPPCSLLMLLEMRQPDKKSLRESLSSMLSGTV